jgi:hypothetical protein
MASRRRKRQAEIRESLVARGGPEFTDDAPDADEHDHQHDEAGIVSGDAAPVHESDRRFAALIAGDDVPGPGTRSTTPRDVWKRWRGYGKHHGTEHPEQTADRIDRQQAARDAQAARIDAQVDGRVQDRHDPRTAGNPGRNGAASRRLNAAYSEQPPAWATSRFDFQAGESWTGSLSRGWGRPAGQRSGHADYAWWMDDGFR